QQQVLEYALDRAEYIVESARQRPAKRRVSSSGRKSLYQKLYELYIEECEKEPELKKLRRNVNLLEKLVSQESVSCLVVNLYPGNEGYSLMLRGKNGSDSETIRLRYEETELLEYLDAEELPPILVDLLEKSQVRASLLQSSLQLILATAEPLCLDPSISVSCTTNRLLYNKQKMNTRSMKRCFRRHSQAALNRQQEMMSHCPALPQLRLLDYLQRRKERKPAPSVDLKISKAGNVIFFCFQVEKYAVAENSVKLDDTQPTVWPAQDVRDDYIFECEVGGQPQRTKVTIFQSMGDPLVYGKIYSARDSKSEEDVTDLHLIHPPFLIGSKTDADRFLTQYKEVYERDVKCQVKMLHNSGSTGSQGQLSPSRENEADGFSALVQSSVLGKGVKHRPPPIKLPAGSACSATPSVTPTPQDPALPQQPTLLTPFAQQQMTLPVMTIPLPTSSTTSSQVMTNPAGLNFINVVGPVCSPQALMSGSNPMLGCSPGTLASGIPLSGLLPSGGLMSGALPAAPTAGGPFGLNNSPGLRPLNLLQLPPGPLIFNSLQQQQLSQFSPQQQSSQSATSSPQQQGDAVSQTHSTEQGLSAQQTAVINLTGVGGFMSPQAAGMDSCVSFVCHSSHCYSSTSLVQISLTDTNTMSRHTNGFRFSSVSC
uniref:SPT20 homolog, SAGA complex component n=1 Tax=Cyprinus carpio TaxID=7962 RepID=A0A8C1YU49_CYPCA